MNEVALMARCVEELSELVWTCLPGQQPLPSTNDERWRRLVGPALLLKATTSLESISELALHGKALDSMVVLRALYENAVTLAWVAINPTYRLNRLYAEFHKWLSTTKYLPSLRPSSAR